MEKVDLEHLYTGNISPYYCDCFVMKAQPNDAKQRVPLDIMELGDKLFLIIGT